MEGDQFLLQPPCRCCSLEQSLTLRETGRREGRASLGRGTRRKGRPRTVGGDATGSSVGQPPGGLGTQVSAAGLEDALPQLLGIEWRALHCQLSALFRNELKKATLPRSHSSLGKPASSDWPTGR